MRTTTTGARRLSLLSLCLLAIVTGAIAGLGAVIFRGLIAIFHNLLFLGKLSWDYNANVHTPTSIWGPFVILVPVVGAVVVAFLVSNFAPEARGHGVPEVMDAIYYNRGIIRPVVAVIKSVASALSIGSGGSVGREGPIVQIGATFGSTVGQFLGMPPWQTIALIGAGAGGGIAATFNTPVGGVLFAIELIVPEISARTLVPVTIGTATAAYIGRLFFGNHPSFIIPALEISSFRTSAPLLLACYALLGVVIGVVSMIYIRSIYSAEDFFDNRVRGSYYRKHVVGMLIVGGIIYALMVSFGHYYVQGVGYATIQDVLSSVQIPIYLLMLLFVLKLLVTSLTLGSGASGGIFSPSLFLGATLGGAYGLVVRALFPQLQVDPAAFAVTGMAGVVAGATGAAVTAMVMVFEMTLDYNVIVPLTIVSAVAYGVRTSLLRQNIYTLKLTRRGHYVPEALEGNSRLHLRAKDMMDTRFSIIGPSLPAKELPNDEATPHYYVVADDSGVYGFFTVDAARAASGGDHKDKSAKDLAKKEFVVVADRATLLDIATQMCSPGIDIAIVTEGAQPTADKVMGVLPAEELSDVLARAMELFSD